MRTWTSVLLVSALVLAVSVPAGATTFTRQSPTAGDGLPAGFTEIGGIVLDLIGANDMRVVSQLAASSLYEGFFDDGTPVAYRGNPGTIGIQSGFGPAITGALGGGLKEAAVRITLYDGDTAPGNFDDHDNDLLLNGLTMQDFSNVATQRTSSDGLTLLGSMMGFGTDVLCTGWFHSSDATFLSNLWDSLVADEQLVYKLNDRVNVYDNYFDFTQGVDGSLIDVEQPPVVNPVIPEPLTMVAVLGGVAGLGGYIRRRRAA